jgi:hypothetical protein
MPYLIAIRSFEDLNSFHHRLEVHHTSHLRSITWVAQQMLSYACNRIRLYPSSPTRLRHASLKSQNISTVVYMLKRQDYQKTTSSRSEKIPKTTILTNQSNDTQKQRKTRATQKRPSSSSSVHSHAVTKHTNSILARQTREITP